jgi:KaiC/GvpD/RAD55 family RecA-like ATPase
MIPPDVKNIVKVKGVENLTELSLALTSLLNNIPFKEQSSKPRRFVFDVLSDMLLSTQSVNTRKWLRETVTKFRVKNFTIIALLNPYMHSKEEVHALLDIFDGQIDLFEKEKEDTNRIFMRVKRMNNTKYSSKEVELAREDLWIQKTK